MISNAQEKLFNPPGYLEDFNDNQREGWTREISLYFDRVKVGKPDLNDGPRHQFYHPLKDSVDSKINTKVVSWIGFPRNVTINTSSDEQRWKEAEESRDLQDEYCEWSVEKNSEGKITKVFFTCEGPEYWDFLGKTSPEKVVKLYQEYINPSVKMEDLFINGEYQARNQWNDSQSGAMHLIQRNNSLYAEIELAGGSSIVRKKQDRIVTESRELIECGKYGDSERNSDPLIGSEVNKLTRTGLKVSLLDPVGLYLGDFDPQGWEMPDQSDPKSYWKILRGTPDFPVRAVYEIPADKGFVVGDIKINGQSIKYGAQITDFVSIKLIATAQGHVDPVPTSSCKKRAISATSLSHYSHKIDTLDSFGSKDSPHEKKLVGRFEF